MWTNNAGLPWLTVEWGKGGGMRLLPGKGSDIWPRKGGSRFHVGNNTGQASTGSPDTGQVERRPPSQGQPSLVRQQLVLSLPRAS
jgi:hypothetical protein